jgi:hypothetical protein
MTKRRMTAKEKALRTARMIEAMRKFGHKVAVKGR